MPTVLGRLRRRCLRAGLRRQCLQAGSCYACKHRRWAEGELGRSRAGGGTSPSLLRTGWVVRARCTDSMGALVIVAGPLRRWLRRQRRGGVHEGGGEGEDGGAAGTSLLADHMAKRSLLVPVSTDLEHCAPSTAPIEVRLLPLPVVLAVAPAPTVVAAAAAVVVAPACRKTQHTAPVCSHGELHCAPR